MIFGSCTHKLLAHGCAYAPAYLLPSGSSSRACRPFKHYTYLPGWCVAAAHICTAGGQCIPDYILVQCIVVANFAIAGENVFAVWQALKELYRVAHGDSRDSSLPENVWHTWQCTFKIATACDLAQIPSNLMFDCGLGGTALGLPTNDALLDVEQLACAQLAQQAYFAQVGMTHVLSCKPQSCQVLQEALASIQQLQENNIPILTSDPPLAHGIVTACLQGMSLGFTFLWERHFRCIIFLPKYKYIMLVDPYGPDRIPDGLLQQLQPVKNFKVQSLNLHVSATLYFVLNLFFHNLYTYSSPTTKVRITTSKHSESCQSIVPTVYLQQQHVLCSTHDCEH